MTYSMGLVEWNSESAEVSINGIKLGLKVHDLDEAIELALDLESIEVEEEDLEEVESFTL